MYMKKEFLFAVLVIAMTSCQKEPNVSIAEESLCPLTDEAAFHRLSIEEAEVNVLSFLSEMRGATRGSDPVTISSKFSKGGFGYATKSDSSDEQPLVYVFNIGDEDGYVIASGDDRAPQVLCIMDQGSFAEDEELTDPAMIALLSRIDTDYRMAVGLPIVDREGNTVLPEQYGYSIPKTRVRVDPATTMDGVAYYDTTPWTTNVSIGTVLPCRWRQLTNFNWKCLAKNGDWAYAGCIPIAVAQIMYHWGVNTTYKGVYYDWNLMHQIIDNQTPYDQYYAAWDKVQSLIAALGDSNNLDAIYGSIYETDASKKGTEVSELNVPRTFRNFGYTNGGTIKDYSLIDLKNALRVGPVLGSGECFKTVTVKKTKILGIVINTQTTNSYYDGHEWVYDNYIERSCMRFGYSGNNTIVSAQSLSETLVHCNMGDGGNGDGYYYSGSYNVKNPVTRSVSVTETTYGTEGLYQYDLHMITDIHP